MVDNSIHIINSKVRKIKIKEILDYKELIFMFTKRNFILSYSQTILGPLWLLINPLLSATVYFVIFGLVAGLASDDLPKILFYLSGTGLWSLFSGVTNSNSRTFLDHNSIYSKVYFPRLIIPLANALSSFIKYLFSLIPFIIFMIFYLIKKEIEISLLRLIFIPFILIMVMLLGLGIALIFSAITVKYRDLNAVFSLFISLLMYITPVIYPLSITGESIYHFLLLINPLTILFETYRYLILGVGYFNIYNLIISLILIVIILFVGIRLFERAEKNFVDIV